jgi:hypothetical protein
LIACQIDASEQVNLINLMDNSDYQDLGVKIVNEKLTPDLNYCGLAVWFGKPWPEDVFSFEAGWIFGLPRIKLGAGRPNPQDRPAA